MNADEFTRMIGHVKPTGGEVVTCACGWAGRVYECRIDTINDRSHPLAGRSGLAWNCPTCGARLWVYYWMVS